jgi:hypothetical protein
MTNPSLRTPSRVSGKCSAVPWLLTLLMLLAGRSRVHADRPRLDADVLQKVKQSTVFLKVQRPDGQTSQGSGFFAYQAGLVLTSAHVLGMLSPVARRPTRVAVVLNSGETDSRTLPAQVLGVDRSSDLAVLRVEGDKLPPPLPTASSKDLQETQELFIFGFPFGERLGRNITVSKTAISSLRKTGARLEKIQVEGGLYPGNSGGPLTNSKGEVVGVAASAFANTRLHFAVPADHIAAFLNGRVGTLTLEPSYREGEQIKLPLEVHLIDPLGRIQKVAVECFAAEPGPPRGASKREPAIQPGDSPHRVVTLASDQKGVARGEIILPPLDNPRQVYWVRPIFTDGVGATHWLGVQGNRLPPPVQRQLVRLAFRPPPEARHRLELLQRASLQARAAAGEPLALRMDLKAELRSQAAKATEPPRGTPLQLEFTHCQGNVLRDGRPLEGEADLRPYLADVPSLRAAMDQDGEGSLARGRTDLSKVPRRSQAALSALGDQLLQSLELLSVSLPGEKVQPLTTWRAERRVLLGLPSAAVPAVVELQYTYLGTGKRDGERAALIDLHGTIRRGQDKGAAVEGKVSGQAWVRCASGEVLASHALFEVELELSLSGKPVRATGSWVVQLHRTALAAGGE